MEGWKWTTFLLCCYGFFKEIRPSEPFLTEYLIGNWTGLTKEQVYHDIYPVWTYSYLAVLVLVFLVTDFFRYNPVIIFEGFSYIATWCLLLWGRGVSQMQLMQFTYGVSSSTEVAYYTYIYAKVSGNYYQQVTSLTRSSLLLGRFLSGLLGQLLVWSHLMDFRQLNYISLISVSVATAVSFFLPWVSSTVYFHRDVPAEFLPVTEDALSEECFTSQLEEQTKPSLWRKFQAASEYVKKDFISSFSNLYILKWSIWWALGTCGNFQVGNYIQPLWEEILPMSNTTETELLNGGVEAVTTLTGAVLAFVLGFLHLNWSLLGEGVLSVISLLDAGVLYWMATTDDIWVAYSGYLVFRALYQMMITVASFEVARNISQNSYGLVFGFNTFLALTFQTILTTVVADSVGLALPPRDQFVVYSVCFLVVGVMFVAVSLLEGWRHGRQKWREEGVWIRNRTGSCMESRTDPPVGCTEHPQ